MSATGKLDKATIPGARHTETRAGKAPRALMAANDDPGTKAMTAKELLELEDTS